MTALYIIGGIVLYLLIGSVVVGLALRIRPDFSDDLDWAVICSWPLLFVLGAYILPFRFFEYLAKRIGGVK